RTPTRAKRPWPHPIGIIGGDGIGPEVVAEALKVVDATGVAYEAVGFDLGGERYLRPGEVPPDTELGEISSLDAVLLGAVGTPDVPPGVLERGLFLWPSVWCEAYCRRGTA